MYGSRRLDTMLQQSSGRRYSGTTAGRNSVAYTGSRSMEADKQCTYAVRYQHKSEVLLAPKALVYLSLPGLGLATLIDTDRTNLDCSGCVD